jgi:thymidylate kinase
MLGLQVRRRLRGYARHTFAGRIKAYCGSILATIRRKARGGVKNKVLQSGGAVIAFLGGDATGKSTLVTESARWLGGTFTVQTLHLGKPPHTWVTLPLRIVLPIARRLFPSQRHEARQSVQSTATSFNCVCTPASTSSLIYAVRALGLAWDRSRLVRKAHRAAAAGEIVICDRYPSGEWGTMDGPRLQVHTDNRTWRTRMVNWIASCEQRLYRENPAPDIALRLRVSIETAKRRNRERPMADRHSDESVEVRHEPNRAWKKTGTKIVHDVDTEMSLAETVLLVKKTIWESL